LRMEVCNLPIVFCRKLMAASAILISAAPKDHLRTGGMDGLIRKARIDLIITELLDEN